VGRSLEEPRVDQGGRGADRRRSPEPAVARRVQQGGAQDEEPQDEDPLRVDPQRHQRGEDPARRPPSLAAPIHQPAPEREEEEGEDLRAGAHALAHQHRAQGREHGRQSGRSVPAGAVVREQPGRGDREAAHQDEARLPPDRVDRAREDLEDPVQVDVLLSGRGVGEGVELREAVLQDPAPPRHVEPDVRIDHRVERGEERDEKRSERERPGPPRGAPVGPVDGSAAGGSGRRVRSAHLAPRGGWTSMRASIGAAWRSVAETEQYFSSESSTAERRSSNGSPSP